MSPINNKESSRRPEWLYGVNPVREALRSGREIKAVFISAGRSRLVRAIREEAALRDIPVKVIHDPKFFDTRFPKGHQGVAAEVAMAHVISIETLLEIPGEKGEAPFFLILDLIEDPRNLGAILRSAEAAGVHGVVSQERRSAGLGPVVDKASAGAAGYIPFCVVSNIKHAIRRMAEDGITVVGTEAGRHPAPWETDLSGPVALVIGSEGGGLRRTVREKCDILVSLPMRGRVESLNASVAAGVLIYEAVRQRMDKQA